MTPKLGAVHRRTLDYEQVLARLKKQGISIRVASPKLVMEEVKAMGEMLRGHHALADALPCM